MRKTLVILASIAAVAGAAGAAFAQTQATSPTTARTQTAPASASSVSAASARVETWTRKQWDSAQKEWAKDKTRWSDCQKQSGEKHLDGRRSWSFLYNCMMS
jgi:Flp pilus assembly protein TadB